jgi:flagellar hook-associated protein 1
VATLRGNLNSLASTLISEVNNLHGAGYSLTGSTGAVLFTGTDAASIGVNSMLVTNPQLLQAAGVPGATGDAKVALALAQLADKKLPGLNNQTLSQGYSQTVADLGQSLADVKSRQSDQSVLKSALLKQRDSVSGVSIDEEMTDLVKYQKAFEASAHLITVVDSMLDTVLNLKG